MQRVTEEKRIEGSQRAVLKERTLGPNRSFIGGSQAVQKIRRKIRRKEREEGE